MTFLSSIASYGKKISHGAMKGLRYGEKMTHKVDTVGHKVASAVSRGISTVERIPVVGQAAAPVTGLARSAVGIVKDVADAAHMANKGLTSIDKGVRGAQTAVHAGNIEAATHILRDSARDAHAHGKPLLNAAKSSLERRRH
jgi:hypothetical protein